MTAHDEKLWQKVDEWREFLQSVENQPALRSLEDSWQKAQGHLFAEEAGLFRRDARYEDNPVRTLMYYLDIGILPPPELLLTLQDCFHDYQFLTHDLERSIFGKPLQKAGNYAARLDKKTRNANIKRAFAKKLYEGKSRTEAAEEIAMHYETSKPEWYVEPEYILRMLRGFKGYDDAAKAFFDYLGKSEK